MDDDYAIRLAILLRAISRWGLLILSLVMSILAYLSGADEISINADDPVQSIPNALPWAALLVVSIIAWKNDVLGGFLVILVGGWLVYFFNFDGANFLLLTFALTMLAVLFGIILVISGYAMRSSYR